MDQLTRRCYVKDCPVLTYKTENVECPSCGKITWSEDDG